MKMETPTWAEKFDDIASGEEGQIPLYGVRVLVSVGDNGLPRYEWIYDNDAQVNRFELSGLLGALSRMVADEHVANGMKREG